MTIQPETRIRPVAHPFSADEIARRADPAAYRRGVLAGHEDAIAHLDELIRDVRSDLQIYRALRNRSQREMSDFRTYDKAAGGATVLLRRLFAIRRALKEATR